MRSIFDPESALMRILIRISDCICASVLWLVFSLPVITAGAASAALYTTVHRYIRQDQGHLWSTFWGAFRAEFKRVTLAWLAALAVLALLGGDALLLRAFRLGGHPAGRLYGLMLVLLCAALVWAAYLPAYAARFDGSVRELLRFGFLLTVLHPLRSLELLAVLLGGVMLALIQPGVLAILPTGCCWLCSLVMEKVFLLHMRPEDRQKTRNGH